MTGSVTNRDAMAGLAESSRPGDAHPLEELAVRSAKAVRETTELYLARRGIDRLANFERFANLESLWVNGNALGGLEHLDCLTRLKVGRARAHAGWGAPAERSVR